MGADCKSVGESLHRFESCTCHALLQHCLQQLAFPYAESQFFALSLLLPSATLLILFSMERSRVMVLPESKA